jgi:hypothetical protein
MPQRHALAVQSHLRTNHPEQKTEQGMHDGRHPPGPFGHAGNL